MVTTRRQSSRPASQASQASQQGTSIEDAIVVDSTKSLRKRSRSTREGGEAEGAEKEELGTTPAKKQKVLPVREKDDVEATKTKTRVVVEIPVSKIAAEVQDLTQDTEEEAEEEDVAHEHGSSDGEDGLDVESEAKEAAPKAIDDGKDSEAVDWEELEISDSESEDGSEVPKEVTKPISVQPKKQSKPATFPKKAEPNPTPVQPKHKRFDSEDPEPEPEFFSTAVEILDSDQESSDDDAPEVVGAQDALKSVQLRAREAVKAVEEQENAIRKKRKERDAKLKKQAEAVIKKRERAEKAEKKTTKEAKQDREADEQMDLNIQVAEDTAPVEKRTIINTSNLPDLLPDEYLQDDEDSESLADLDLEVTRTKPKRMKFSDLVEKKPKDRRKGSTTYRVLEIRSKNLAPKSSFHAKNTKESWLKGRGPMGAGGVRKVASGGFFKKK